MIEVDTNSVATTGDAGSSKSALRSFTQVEWMSPASTMGFAAPLARTAESSRVRCGE